MASLTLRSIQAGIRPLASQPVWIALGSLKILHHSQQDLKNRVFEQKNRVYKLSSWQETRFLTQVQDVSRFPSVSELTQNYPLNLYSIGLSSGYISAPIIAKN